MGCSCGEIAPLYSDKGWRRHYNTIRPHLTWIQATSTRSVRACIRRVADCATPSGSAGHAGATANLKLTFHLDHSAGLISFQFGVT
jgi:hypothetical protein